MAEEEFRLVDEGRARVAAEALFRTVHADLAARLPRADIRHVGATAVPGCLTKGDLDIVVRVLPEDFAAAHAVLGTLYAVNTGSVRTETFAAFEDGRASPHLGVQLVTFGGPFDVFHQFAEILRRWPSLLSRYNALKRRHDGAPMADYRGAKDAFVEDILTSFQVTARS